MKLKLHKLPAVVLAASIAVSPMSSVVWAEGDVAAVADQTSDGYYIDPASVVFTYDPTTYVPGEEPVGTVSYVRHKYVVVDGEGALDPDDYLDTETYPIAGTCTTEPTCTETGTVSFRLELYNDFSAASKDFTVEALGHDVVESARVVNYPAECETDGLMTIYYKCSRCSSEEFEPAEVILYATDHDFSDDYRVDMNRLNNIMVDEDGNLVLDENGKPQAADKRKNASYYLVHECENILADGSVCGEPDYENEIFVPIELTEGVETFVSVVPADCWEVVDIVAELIGATPKPENGTSNTYLYDTDYSYELVAGLYETLGEELKNPETVEDIIRLEDCTESGTYQLLHFNLITEGGEFADGDPIDLEKIDFRKFMNDAEYRSQFKINYLASDIVTIPAHHYWGEVYIDAEASSPNLLKDENGAVIPAYDENGAIIGAYNTHCGEEAVVVLAHKCENCDETEVVDEITLPATGRHSWSREWVLDEESDPTYAEIDKDTHVKYENIYNECLVCGELRWDVQETVEDHVRAYRKDNEVSSTCGASGSYDRVVYCSDCDAVISTTHIITDPTYHHVYGEYEFVWDGETVINGRPHDDAFIGTSVRVKAVCQNCGGNVETPENIAGLILDGNWDWNGVIESDVVFAEGEYTSELVWFNDFYMYGPAGRLVIEMSEPSVSEFSCKPSVATLTATFTEYGEDGVDMEPVSDTREVAYYASVADYESRTSHVAGAAEKENVVEPTATEPGSYDMVVRCIHCGDVLSSKTYGVDPTGDIIEPLTAVTGLTAAPAGKNRVSLSWDAVKGAEGYLIIAMNDVAHGQQIGYVMNRTTYVDIKADSEDYNFYWVVPFYKNAAGRIVKGELSEYVYAMGIKPLAAVTGLEAVSGEEGVSLTWNAVDCATNYIVKAKTGSKWTVTTVDTTAFVDTAASAEEYTFYWVIPCYTTEADKLVVGPASNYVYGIAK